jgi:hypothetical protein
MDGVLKRAKGVEPYRKPAVPTENSATFAAGGAEAAPTLSAPTPADEDLRVVADAWPLLPAAVRAGIVAMVTVHAASAAAPQWPADQAK